MAFSAWGQRIDELLADGEWHELEAVILGAMGAVPPGVAYRRGEHERSRVRGGVAAPDTRVLGDRATSASTGARALVRGVVDSRIRRGTVERWGTQVRRRP